jgi:CRP-like cAMP-binding protein
VTVDAELQSNRILKAVPEATRRGIAPLVEIESLRRGHVLQPADQEITHCYFPLDGVASLLVTEASGKSVDTAIIGREGFVGLPVFLGTGQMPAQAMVQVDMRVAAVPAADLRRILSEEAPLADLIQRYTQVVLVELARLVLCNRVHSLDQRLARWLLQLNERVDGGTPMDLTHEFLAEMLGTERPSVTNALGTLTRLGVLTNDRGTIAVRDAAALEAGACDCFATIRDERVRLVEQSAPTGVS